MRTRSTNLSIPEAKRERLLPPCSCEFPPGIGGAPIALISCETQTHVVDISLQFVQTVFGEGSSHLTDDGWAETQKYILETRQFITDLQSGDCFNQTVLD